MLKERLSSLPAGNAEIQLGQEESLSAGAEALVLSAVRLYESFLDKRESPPSASTWARFVDMFEQEARKLKRLLKNNDR